MTADYEKLRQEETDKSSKLQELMSVSQQNNKKCYNSVKNNKHQTSTTQSPSRIINCLSPKKTNNCTTATTPTSNLFLDEFDIDEQNFNKIRKNFFNTSAQCHHHYNNQLNSPTFNEDDDNDNETYCCDNVALCKQYNQNNQNKSLISTLCRTIPLALPTLQLHLLISLTMVLLTHRCPQYLIVL